jgi:K+-sensing histidine kinase KdpD
VIGSSQRSRWQQLTGGGSRVKRVIDEAGALNIDVHVIALRNTSPAGPPEPGSTDQPALVSRRSSASN